MASTTPDDPGLKVWAPRQPVSADRLNALQNAVITSITVGPGLAAARKGNQLALRLTNRPRTSTRGLFLVTLVSDGGSGGSAGSPVATWTYSVWNEGDDTETAEPIAKLQSPMLRLPGIMTAGTYGVGTLDSTGTFRLWQSNEAPTPEQCS